MKLSLIKHRFFNQPSNQDIQVSWQENDFNLDQFKSEFSTLYQVFIANKNEWIQQKELIAYLYYLCNFLMYYYQCDYVRADFESYHEQAKQLEQFISNHFAPEDRHFINEFSLKLKERCTDSTINALSVTKIREYITLINARRSQWGYSRGLALQAINCLRRLSFDQYISDDVIALLNKTRQPLVLLGIILYGSRFLINFSLVIKHLLHTLFNTELSASKILKQELEKRSYLMTNDAVWFILNLITTYNFLFKISSSAMMPIMFGGLCFDVGLLVIQGVYDTIKYDQTVQELSSQLSDASEYEKRIIQRQIDILNDQWETQYASSLFNISAAVLLTICFGVGTITTGPFFLITLALLSSIGNAIYNTVNELKVYHQSFVAISREKANGLILNDLYHQELMEHLKKEHIQVSKQFWEHAAINTIAAAIIITSAIIYWPVAVFLTIAFMAYLWDKSSNADSTPNTEWSSNIYRLMPSPDGIEHNEEFEVDGLPRMLPSC